MDRARLVAALLVMTAVAASGAASGSAASRSLPRPAIIRVVHVPAAVRGVAVVGRTIWATGGGDALGYAPGLWKLDTRSGRVLRHLRSDTDGLLYAFGSLWTIKAHALVRLDPSTGGAVARIPAPGLLGGTLSSGGGSVWAGRTRVDPRGNVASVVPWSGSARDLIFAAGRLWLIGRTVRQIDRSSGRVVSEFSEPGFYPNTNLAAGAGCLWLASIAQRPNVSGHVVCLDPVSGRPVGRRVAIGAATPLGVVVADGYVWLVTKDGVHPGSLLRVIDPETRRFVGRELRIPVGPGQVAPFRDGHSLWIAGLDDGIAHVALR